MKKLILPAFFGGFFFIKSFAQPASLRFSPKMVQACQPSRQVHFNKTYQAATWRHFQQLGRPSMLDHPGAAPVVYDFHALAVFLKMEVKLEKAVSFPIKFRLGDVQYVDRMEGKIDY